MNDPDPWREELADLIAAGVARGFVTYDELGERLAGIESDPVALEAVLRALDSAGVPVTDSPQEVAEPPTPGAEAMPDTGPPDALTAYERDLARVRPLDPEEEQRLAASLQEALDGLRAIRANRGEAFRPEAGLGQTEDVFAPYHWARERLAARRDQIPRVPAVDEQTLERMRELVSAVDDVRGRFVQGTMRLVLHLARRYRDRGVEMLDLIQEGNAGLLRAAQRYDPRRGHRFVSYATWWIRQGLARAVREQGKAFRIPPGIESHLRRLSLVRRQLTQSLEREPTASELAESVGLDEGEVNALLSLTASPLRLDGPVGNDDEGSLEGVLSLETAMGPMPDGVSSVLKAQVERVIDTLEPVEGELMRLRHGIADGTPRSLEEVAKMLRITRERAHQIEERALRKLRHPARRQWLDECE